MNKLVVVLCLSAHDGAMWMAKNPDKVRAKKVLRIHNEVEALKLKSVSSDMIEAYQTESFMLTPVEELLNFVADKLPVELPAPQTIFVGDEPRTVYCLDLHIMSDTSGIPPTVTVDNQYRVFGSYVTEDAVQVHFFARGVGVKWGEELHITFTSEFLEVKTDGNSKGTEKKA